jgi:hypothetical protein
MGRQNATSKPKLHSSKTARRHRQRAIEQEVQVFRGVEEADEPVQIRQLTPAFSSESDTGFDMENGGDNSHDEYGCLDEE